MTEATEREEEANPYNQNKPWHNVKETRFDSADTPYFEDPQLNNEDSEKEEAEDKREARKDKPYKKLSIIGKSDMMIAASNIMLNFKNGEIGNKIF